MKKNVYILCFLLFALTGQAQNPVYTVIDKTKGLPSNTVYDIFQDKAGFIWIAHDKGISKYDGLSFTHFQHHEQTGKSLSDIMQDADGKIWCQNFIGQVFYMEHDSLKLCTALQPTGTYSQAAILDGEVLVLPGRTSLRYLNTRTQRVEEKPLPGFSSIHYTYSYNNRYYFFNKETQRLFTLTKDNVVSDVQGPGKPDYFYALQTKADIYYFPKYPNRESAILNGSFEAQPFSFPANTFIQNFKIVNDSLLVALTTNGFYFFNHRFEPTPNVNNRFFTNKNTSTLLQDAEGNWWVGTLNEGILFIPNLNNRKKFEDISFTVICPNPEKTSFFIGTSANQVWKYSIANGKLVNYSKQELTQEVLALHYHPATNAVAYSSDKFYAIRPGKKTIVHEGSIKDIGYLDENYYAVAASGFVALYATEQNQKPGIWHKAYEGIGSYADKSLSEFRLNSEALRVRTLTVHHDTIFTATTSGLIAFTLQGPVEINYQGKSIAVSDFEIYDNTVYVATLNDGLLKIKHGNLIACFKAVDTSIYKVKIDKGIAWMLTETSLLGHTLATGQLKTIDHTNGLPADELRDLAIVNDTVYLAGSKGLIYFPASLARTNSYAPKLVLNSVFVNQDKRLSTNNFQLSSTENDIRINFSVIAYKTGQNIKLFYKINAADWQQLDNNSRELHLASLSPDTYAIEIKAINEDGVESTDSLKINMLIKKPFYRETWFLFFCLSLFIIILNFIHQANLKKIQKKNIIERNKLQLEQDLQQSLLTSIKAQMNPHFIYNSLSSIQSFVYSDDKANAIKYLDSFSELTRKVLELSNRETILLSEEIQLLETYISLEKMRFGDSFCYTITCDSNLDISFVRLPSMIIQPFVENAIKHGLLHRKDEKKLSIYFQKDGDVLRVIIDDNGVGRKISSELKKNKNKAHQSFSISANNKRLELLNTKRKDTIGLEITDKVDELLRATGTTVTITIPISIS